MVLRGIDFLIAMRATYTENTKLSLEFSALRRIIKPVFHWKSCLRWLPNANKIDTNKMKCTTYMPNASPSRWGPNATYIPPAHVGGWRCG